MSTHTRTVLALALTPALALTAVASGASAAPAPALTTATTTTTTVVGKTAVPGPWTLPRQLGTSLVDGHRLEAAGDGTLVSLTLDRSADGQSAQRVTRVRPAGSTLWKNPQAWPGAAHDAELFPLADGTVRLVWRAQRDGDPWLRMATLAPGATSFSAPEYVAPVPAKGYHHLAGAPDGHLVATWVDAGVVTVAEKAGADAAWSAPLALNTQPPSGQRDVRYLELAVASGGTALVVWDGPAGEAVVRERKPGATQWTEPGGFPLGGAAGVRTKLYANPLGGFDLFWEEGTALVHGRRLADGSWEKPAVVVDGAGTYGLTRPVYQSNGDVFVAGAPSSSQAPWYRVRKASTGAWTQVQPFPSQRARVLSLKVVRTAGGSVTAVWQEGSAGSEQLRRAVYKGGTWSVPRKLGGAAVFATIAGLAADAGDRPVALWEEYTRNADGSLSPRAYTASTLTRARSGWRDYLDRNGEGGPAVLGLTSAGTLQVWEREGAGLSAAHSVPGWPAGTKVQPFGDLNGDRCGDVLVRLPGGAARMYLPVCGGLPSPGSSYKSLSSDWSAYDTVVSHPDLTGDGRPDLLARSASTGNAYLYANDGAGGFAARVKVASGWSGYKKLIATHDLDGDGRRDLLALDRSNELWRLGGTGTGTFKAPVLVFKDWGASYLDVIGDVDVNGDGYGDLVTRDTDGKAWYQPGRQGGSFAGRLALTGTNWSGTRIS